MAYVYLTYWEFAAASCEQNWKYLEKKKRSHTRYDFNDKY